MRNRPAWTKCFVFFAWDFGWLFIHFFVLFDQTHTFSHLFKQPSCPAPGSGTKMHGATAEDLTAVCFQTLTAFMTCGAWRTNPEASSFFSFFFQLFSSIRSSFSPISCVYRPHRIAAFVPVPYIYFPNLITISATATKSAVDLKTITKCLLVMSVKKTCK